MLTEEGLAFFHRKLVLFTKFRLQPFTVRKNLLIDVKSKRTDVIGWASVILNMLYLPLIAYRIKESGKIEGVVHSFLILISLVALALKLTILFYHSELVQVVNNILLLNPKLGNTN